MNGSDPGAGQQPPVDGPSPAGVSLSFWSPFRKELLAWLQKEAPSLAELYESAVILMYERRLPGCVRSIANSVREIANSLPFYLAGIPREQVNYKDYLDEISELWTQLNGKPVGPPGVTVTENVPSVHDAVARRLNRKLSDLIEKHRQARLRPFQSAKRLFEAVVLKNGQLPEDMVPIVQHWVEIPRWFVKHAHDNGKVDAQCDWTEFREKFELFETALGALARGFYKTIKELDDILEDTNT